MKKMKIENTDQKTFSDLTNRLWFTDGDKIKIGENMSKIMSGDSQTLDVKEILVGDIYHTWKIVITDDDKIHLLKTSRELK